MQEWNALILVTMFVQENYHTKGGIQVTEERIIHNDENCKVIGIGEDRSIQSVTLNYGDGTSETKTKGMFVSLKEGKEENLDIVMEFCNMTKEDIGDTIYGIGELANGFPNN